MVILGDYSPDAFEDRFSCTMSLARVEIVRSKGSYVDRSPVATLFCCSHELPKPPFPTFKIPGVRRPSQTRPKVRVQLYRGV
jgi:hypothetical protein